MSPSVAERHVIFVVLVFAFEAEVGIDGEYQPVEPPRSRTKCKISRNVKCEKSLLLFRWRTLLPANGKVAVRLWASRAFNGALARLSGSHTRGVVGTPSALDQLEMSPDMHTLHKLFISML